MRVAVYLPAGHPEVGVYPEGHERAGEQAEPTPFAYNLGRIEEGVHNAPPGFEPVPYFEYVQAVLARARQDYPDAEKIVVERLVQSAENPDEGAWIAADEFDPAVHAPVGPGNVKSKEVHVTSDQQTGGDQ